MQQGSNLTCCLTAACMQAPLQFSLALACVGDPLRTAVSGDGVCSRLPGLMAATQQLARGPEGGADCAGLRGTDDGQPTGIAQAQPKK